MTLSHTVECFSKEHGLEVDTRDLREAEARFDALMESAQTELRANAYAPRSHASHEAPSGLRPSGFDRLSQGENR